MDINASLVLILSGDQLYQMDFQKLVKFHVESRAEVTVPTVPVKGDLASSFGIMKVDESNRIIHFHEKPLLDELQDLESQLSGNFDRKEFPEGRAFLASMGIYLFEKDFLVRTLEEVGEHDFGKNVIPELIGHYSVMSYPFYGYWTDIGTIRSFYEANLDLTMPLPKFNFYSSTSLIYTRV